MGVLRRVALGVLWLLAGLGTLCGVAWGATALGLIKPLVVISGSMEPEIMTGDLIIDTKVPAASLQVGDVASLPSELTTNLVTHRVVRIVPATDGAYTVTMKGDANAFEDALDYTVSGDVWVPTAQLAGVGTAIIFGSAVHIRNAATSSDICATVGSVPSAYVTWPSLRGGAIAVKPPGTTGFS